MNLLRVFCLIRMRQQGHANSNTLLQQNTSVLNRVYRLTEVDVYNSRKTVIVVVVMR